MAKFKAGLENKFRALDLSPFKNKKSISAHPGHGCPHKLTGCERRASDKKKKKPAKAAVVALE